ncbi:MAG: nucleotidyltransferase domain-containing protein [Alphaproteobacteria bacterium]|jgi:hypothetical protein|nr:nucleotidyltransferase domain-containing protein [Alphaproteobacteria bacterium]
MRRAHIIETLRGQEAALRARGVRHAALFGSAARGGDPAGGEIDILVEFEPEAGVTVFDYVGLKRYISGLFDEVVEVVDREALKPHRQAGSARDAVYAF